MASLRQPICLLSLQASGVTDKITLKSTPNLKLLASLRLCKDLQVAPILCFNQTVHGSIDTDTGITNGNKQKDTQDLFQDDNAVINMHEFTSLYALYKALQVGR